MCWESTKSVFCTGNNEMHHCSVAIENSGKSVILLWYPEVTSKLLREVLVALLFDGHNIQAARWALLGTANTSGWQYFVKHGNSPCRRRFFGANSPASSHRRKVLSCLAALPPWRHAREALEQLPGFPGLASNVTGLPPPGAGPPAPGATYLLP